MKTLKLSVVVVLLLLLTLTACDKKDADTETSHDYHIWYDAGFEVEPECTFDGSRKYVCECGDVRFETVESVGHAWGDWYMVKESTCTEPGLKKRRCWCQSVEEEMVEIANHSEVSIPAVKPTCNEPGWSEGVCCGVCDAVLVEPIELDFVDHTYVGDRCSACQTLKPSQGLLFTSNGDGTCLVSGAGSCEDREISIPRVSPSGERVIGIAASALSNLNSWNTIITIPYGVTHIGEGAFAHNHLQNVVIPKSVVSIGEKAFYGSDIVSITFNGTCTQWREIEKGANWKQHIGHTNDTGMVYYHYTTVYCTDGYISEDATW